jgi:hypothetical protein
VTFASLAISDAADICTSDEDLSHTWVCHLPLARIVSRAIGFNIPAAKPNPSEHGRRILLKEFFAECWHRELIFNSV